MEEIAIGLYAPKQTNTGLYVEMHELGHPIEDILRVKTAYSLCAKMFNGRYRKTGRPFLCHAVGAASSVAHFGGTVDQIIAAMFHATYDSGQFPDGRSGNRWDHPDWLRARLGPDVEGLVARLDEMSFEKGDPERMAAEDISAGDEDIVFMTLAHEVDDLADAGLFVAPKYGNNLDSRLAACAALARRVGNESMATVFEVYADRYPSWSWASALQEPKLEGFRIAPNLRAYLKLRREHRRGGGIEIL